MLSANPRLRAGGRMASETIVRVFIASSGAVIIFSAFAGPARDRWMLANPSSIPNALATDGTATRVATSARPSSA